MISEGSERVTSSPALFTSSTPEWYTPPEIIGAVLDLFDGTIDLDPCSNSHEAPIVPAREHFTRADDGLHREWRGKVYMNPPYGREIQPWIEKIRSEFEGGRVVEAIALVPARTDTRWFRILSGRYPRCEVAGRLKFSGCDNSAPFPSTVFYLGNRVQQFAEAFGGFGVIVVPWSMARPALAEAKP